MANDLENLSPEKLSVGWPWKLMLFSLTLLGILIASYLGLRFGYGTVLDSNIASQDAEITALAESVPENEQQALLLFYTQLGNLRGVLSNHVVTAEIWSMLERVTNRNIYYTTADLDINRRVLSLDGVARSYDFLTQQLAAYKNAPEIEQFTLDQADVRGTNVAFRISLTLKETTLK